MRVLSQSKSEYQRGSTLKINFEGVSAEWKLRH